MFINYTQLHFERIKKYVHHLTILNIHKYKTLKDFIRIYMDFIEWQQEKYGNEILHEMLLRS
jgi:hypothetical protein